MRRVINIFPIICLVFLFVGTVEMVAQKQFKAFLFTKTAGWHHESINAGVTGIQKIADEQHFDLVWSEDAERFMNDKMLKQFDVIIFLNTTADVLTDDQQKAMERFIQAGKGFVGIHAASDTEYGWDWYTQLVGHMFVIHPKIQTAELHVVDTKFPGTQGKSERFLWTDEWYEFGPAKSKNLKYIMTIDENTYDPVADWGKVKGKGMGDFHPVSWYQNFDGGRSFYTALGHMPEKYENQWFMQHLYGGIYWAATGKGMRN